MLGCILCRASDGSGIAESKGDDSIVAGTVAGIATDIATDIVADNAVACVYFGGNAVGNAVDSAVGGAAVGRVDGARISGEAKSPHTSQRTSGIHSWR